MTETPGPCRRFRLRAAASFHCRGCASTLLASPGHSPHERLHRRICRRPAGRSVPLRLRRGRSGGATAGAARAVPRLAIGAAGVGFAQHVRAGAGETGQRCAGGCAAHVAGCGGRGRLQHCARRLQLPPFQGQPDRCADPACCLQPHRRRSARRGLAERAGRRLHPRLPRGPSDAVAAGIGAAAPVGGQQGHHAGAFRRLADHCGLGLRAPSLHPVPGGAGGQSLH